ncbi:MAG: peptidylprolyl isomerase [Candidatus Omnitrophota bacterium]
MGEAFGKPVTVENFNYYYKTAAVFTRSGKESRDEEDVRQEAWQNLVFRHEARELDITIEPEKLKEDIKRLMDEKGVAHGSQEYRDWVENEFGEDVKTFERRIEDLLIINKFIDIKFNPEIIISEEEVKQKFLNQYNSFESEYIGFESEEDAKEFHKKLKTNPKLWKDTYDEKRKLGQKGAAWINIMTLEALIDLWKIPKDDAYRILSRKEGDFIAAKYYYGDAVFRLLRRREADMSMYTDNKKEYLRSMILRQRKQKAVRDYFEGLLKRANHRDYIHEQKLAIKVEELKLKSLLALETNRGIIVLRLFPDIAPKACENFIGLAEKGYYDGIIFHRVVKDFVIQTGDPTGTGTGGESIWGEPFKNEISEDVSFDKPGILGMANSGPDTNSSQFFITTKEAPSLNKKYTIFGEVIEGLDVVKKIESTPVDEKDNPRKEQKIVKAYIKGMPHKEKEKGI